MTILAIGGTTLILISFLFLLIFFLLIRSVMLWYWKINKQIELQQQSTLLLYKIYEKNGGHVDWTEVDKLIYK